MEITSGMYFLPGGKSTQKVGVAADVSLPGWFVFEAISVKQRWTIHSQPRQSRPSSACGGKLHRNGSQSTSG